MSEPADSTAEDRPDGPSPLALVAGMALVTRYRLRLTHAADARLGGLGEDWELGAAAWTGPRAAFAGFFTPDPDDPVADVRRRLERAAAWGALRLASQPAERCDILLVALSPISGPLAKPYSDARVRISVISADPATGTMTELCTGAGGLPGVREMRSYDKQLRKGAAPPTLAAVDLAERETVRGGYVQPARRALSSTPYVTYGLIASWVVIWLIQHALVHGTQLPNGIVIAQSKVGSNDFGALITGPGTPVDWWRLFAAGFVHSFSSPWHIAVNSWAMFWIGRSIEQLYGRFALLGAYFACVLGSSLFILALTAAGVMEPAITVGASGGILGLLGIMLTIGRTEGKNVPAGLVNSLRTNAIGNAAFIMVYSFIFAAFISWQGHLGGLVTGALLGLGLPPLEGIGGREMRRYEEVLLAAIIVVGVVALALAAVNVVSVAVGSTHSMGGYQ